MSARRLTNAEIRAAAGGLFERANVKLGRMLIEGAEERERYSIPPDKLLELKTALAIHRRKEVDRRVRDEEKKGILAAAPVVDQLLSQFK